MGTLKRPVVRQLGSIDLHDPELRWGECLDSFAARSDRVFDTRLFKSGRVKEDASNRWRKLLGIRAGRPSRIVATSTVAIARPFSPRNTRCLNSIDAPRNSE